jgi:uncharacterized coiled-coil protein SlyX
MTMPERDRLISRIRQVRRVAAAAQKPTAAARKPTAAPPAPRDAQRIADLEARISHLERLVQGLQDSVHRESERHAALIADLQGQVQPAALTAALSRYSRDRGL